MNPTNPNVDFYFRTAKQWQDELAKLRTIVLSCDVTEELKWGVPCYTYDEHNVVMIHAFKNYCAIMFVKGALLGDPDGVLVQQTKNVRAARQIRFTSTREITALKSSIKSYIAEAVAIEKAGLKVDYGKTVFEVVEEFQQALDAKPALKAAFKALTPGRQRQYLLHFSSAKLAKTRASRVEKAMPLIMKGKGLDD